MSQTKGYMDAIKGQGRKLRKTAKECQDRREQSIADLREAANLLIGMDGIFFEKDYRKMCRLAKRLRAIADRGGF